MERFDIERSPLILPQKSPHRGSPGPRPPHEPGLGSATRKNFSFAIDWGRFQIPKSGLARLTLFYKVNASFLNRSMKPPIIPLALLSFVPFLTFNALAGLETGEQINLTIRGVDPAEQQKVSGIYRIGESGGVRLPLLDQLVSARGLTPEQFARAAEAAYQSAGIYARPAIEVEILQGKDQQGPAVVSVGGQVRRAGDSPFRKGMTVIQALDAAGGRNDFGGRNLFLLRNGKQYCLDFTNLAHKNIELRPGDSIQVEPKGILDRWKGSEETVKRLIEAK